ncbi:MAG: xylS, partial [Paenibacillus sp.]|nr:xylS [Paenibacillus sp.]
HDVQFQTSAGTCIRIRPLTPDTFRITLNHAEKFTESVLIRYGIIRLPDYSGDYKVEDEGDFIVIRTSKADLRVSRVDGQMSLAYLNRMLEIDPLLPDDGSLGLRVQLTPEERIYGLGDESRKTLLKRGRNIRIELRKGESHAPIPYWMSSLGWGMFLNTTRRHEIDMGYSNPDALQFALSGGQLDVIVYTGYSYADLLDKFTAMTGRPVLLPIWAYGLSFACNQQANAREMIEDVMKFRHESIPCDMIGLESTWMETRYDRSTGQNWHPQRFYIPDWNPKGQHTFIGTLAGIGCKLSLWLCSEYDLSAYEERALKRQAATDAGADIPASPNGEDEEEAWYDHLAKFVDQGVKAFKLSENSAVRELTDMRWSNGMTNEEMDLLYPLLLSKQMHYGFKRQTGQRPMIYTADSYAGIQQYAAIWTGGLHVGSHEDSALVTMLNDGLAGLSNLSNDMDIHSPEGIHFGFMQPWCMVNSWAYWRHPSLLEGRLRDIFKTYAKLRYRLLPYVYTAAHTAARTGMPMIRAMPLFDAHDPKLSNAVSQYMFGDSLLVAAFTTHVVLPSGEWIDYWTGVRYSGPLELEYDIPEHVGGPLFVRAGAIIPMWPDMDFIGQKSTARMSLHIYPRGESEFTMVEDDGISFGYAQGEVAVTSFSCVSSERRTTVRIGGREGRYAGMPAKRSYDVHLYMSAKPGQITVGGTVYKEAANAKKLSATPSWFYDRLSGCVLLFVDATETVQIEISHEAVTRSKPKESSRPRIAVAKSPVAPAAKEQAGGFAPLEQEKNMEIGLETGDWNKTRGALERLLKDRTDTVRSIDDVREHFLVVSGLLVRFLESKGWPLKEVIGESYEQFLHLQSMTEKEEGRNLLLEVAERITAYSRNARQASVHPLVQRLMDMVNEAMDQQFFTLSDAAERLHVNASHLSRLFKQETGTSFSDYAMDKKMAYAKQLMQNGSKVADAAASTGFRDTGYFIRVFRKYWGVTPGELKV